MSHFTHIKTKFQNLFYLEKALNKLNVNHSEKKVSGLSKIKYNTSLIISQPNGHDIEFAWDGQKYELIADMSFWEQSCPIDSFIDKVSQEYAGELITGESQRIGFQPIKHKENNDGSKTLVLERWKNS